MLFGGFGCRQNAFRAGGSAADQESRDADSGAPEAAEPLAKKRVAFKDDLVDGAELGNRRSLSPRDPRRSSSAFPPTPPQDDLAAAPPGTSSPPRPNRLGPRGRPGSVGGAGRRPLNR